MSTRFCAVGAVLIVCVLLAASAAAQQPRITNGQVVPQPAGALAQTFGSVVAAQADVAWVGYSVPVRACPRSFESRAQHHRARGDPQPP